MDLLRVRCCDQCGIRSQLTAFTPVSFLLFQFPYIPYDFHRLNSVDGTACPCRKLLIVMRDCCQSLVGGFRLFLWERTYGTVTRETVVLREKIPSNKGVNRKKKTKKRGNLPPFIPGPFRIHVGRQNLLQMPFKRPDSTSKLTTTTNLPFFYTFQGMNNKRALLLPPTVHGVERARAPMIHPRHTGKDTNTLPGRYGICLEYRQCNFIGMLFRHEALRKMHI